MLTQSEYIVLVTKYLHMSVFDLEDCYNNKMLPSLEHIVIRVILKAMKDGDVDKLEKLLERVIGKSTVKAKVIEVKDPEDEKAVEANTFKIEVVNSGVKVT